MKLDPARVEVMTFLLGIWLAVAALGAGGLVAMGAFHFLVSVPGHFPGDPPVADLCLDFALWGWLFIGLALGASRALSRFIDPKSTLRVGTRVLTGLLALSVVALTPALAEVGGRHFGEWRQLKAVLEEGQARVVEHVRPRGEVLSREEFELARAWLQEHPVSFHFKDEAQPVRLRMMSSRPPYVGVDFGGGGQALFDLVTMRCTYAD